MEINGALNVWSYGYKVTCEINGQDVGIRSDQSSSARLMNKEHPMYAQVMKENPKMAKNLFVLKSGSNSITVRYEHTRPMDMDYMQASLMINGYSLPVVLFYAKVQKSGTLEGSFDIQAKAPAKFSPLVKVDDPDGLFVFINLGDEGGSSLKPALNGERQMSTNVPGIIALHELKPKTNTLEVEYKAGPAGMHFDVIGPKGVLTIKKPAGAQGTETFILDAA